MQEVRGQLGKGIVSDVLRHVAFLRDTGRLVLLSDTQQGVVVVRGGRPVHAACRRPDGSAGDGLEAFATLLGWESGSYRFASQEEKGPEGDAGASAAVHANDTLVGDIEELLEAAHARRATNGSVRAVPAGGAAATSDADVFLFPAGPSSGIGLQTVLSRCEVVAHAEDVAVPRGALALWLRLDGTTPLEDHAGASGLDVDRAIDWAARLVHEGLAEVEPEPVVAPEFASRLSAELIEIMGPMGEILVEEAVDELGLDPDDLPVARVPDLVDALASQLQRSDWQMRLRGRAARLQQELTIHPHMKEPR